MAKNILNKVTMITSPVHNSGKTTIANNLAYLFAKRGYVTCVIEFNRQVGTSPYLNDVTDVNIEKSLKTAIEASDEKAVVNSFIQSKHNECLFTLSLRQNNQVTELYKFGQEQIEKIIKIARSNFDKVFIDAPMDYLDNSTHAALNSYPDQIYLVMDDNIASWHRLKLYDLFFQQIDVKNKFTRMSCIINKSFGLIPSNFIDTLRKDFKVLNFKETYEIPFITEIIKANNEGQLLADIVPSNKKEKKLHKTFNDISKAIEEGKSQIVKEKKQFKSFFKKRKKDEETSENETA